MSLVKRLHWIFLTVDVLLLWWWCHLIVGNVGRHQVFNIGIDLVGGTFMVFVTIDRLKDLVRIYRPINEDHD